jgi:hypothetical protein
MRLALLLLAAAAARAEVSGVVVNATTGKPQAGSAVTLFKIDQNGPNAVDTIRSEADGAFKFPNEAQGPVLLQAVHEGVVYSKMLPPGRPTTGVTVEVFNSSPKPGEARVATHMMLLEPMGGELSVSESVIWNNPGKTAYYEAKDGAMRFYLPEAAGGKVKVSVSAPGSIPIQRGAEKTSQPGIYKVDYAVKPGETRFDLSYTVPMERPAKFAGRVLHKGSPVRIVAPEGVTLKGAALATLGTEPQTKATIYEVSGDRFEVEIEGTGTLRGASAVENEEEDGGAGLQQIRPRIYVRYREILVLAALALGAGFALLYRREALKS